MAYPALTVRGMPMPSTALDLRKRMLLLVLYVSVLLSSIAFIEPSLHDLMMPLLAGACIVAGMRTRIVALTIIGPTALAAFIALALSVHVIDSDHWRHFFLLLGMICGLGAAAVNYRRKLQRQTMWAGGRLHVGAT